MRIRLAILAVGFLLAVGASAAEPVHLVTTPTTAPAAAVAVAVEDASRNLPLPARSAVATTQSATAGRAATAGGDPLDMKRMAVALAIVLGAMYVTHLVWKRLGMPGSANRNAGALQVISRLNLSPKQQVVLLRVGRRVVLIGNSGGQMNSLCEIGDAEEVAGLLGQAATERTDSISAESFNSVLGTEEKRFEDEQNADVPAHGGDAGAEEHQALSNTRDELSDMMDKVRNLSRQFRPNPKGE
jgi:flagellar biogenesis protein FliO